LGYYFGSPFTLVPKNKFDKNKHIWYDVSSLTRKREKPMYDKTTKIPKLHHQNISIIIEYVLDNTNYFHDKAYLHNWFDNWELNKYDHEAIDNITILLTQHMHQIKETLEKDEVLPFVPNK